MAPPKTTASKPAPKRKAAPAAKKTTKPKTAKPPATPAPPMTPEDELLASMDPRHVRFVEGYLLCYNQTLAYREVYDPQGKMSDNSCAANASRLLRMDKVARLVALRVKQSFEDADGDLKTRTLELLLGWAFADPNELSQLRRDCCRYCYGIDHKWQMKPSEWQGKLDTWQADLRKAQALQEAEPPEPDPQGGLGYDPRLPPVESCPECFGEGIEREFFHDTRHIAPATRALYGGVQRTKDGLKIVQHDQGKAREILARVLKLFDDTAEVVVGIVSEDKLDAMYDRAMQRAAEGRARMAERHGLPAPIRPGAPQ
ncbi:hypothetical protein BJP27_24370 (plasmid) [Pseudomonas oryzihabitans]|nr:hypothetical protein BJP27_24370 [Pseudomonas psychrotolerans]